MRIKFKCPYCNVENTTDYSNINNDLKEIVLCDSEIGGCDSYFSIIAWPDIKIEVYAMELKSK